jgi:hypothetical protein
VSESFAYSLSQDEDGWRWSVYDEDGVTVADGAHASQARRAGAWSMPCAAGDGTRPGPDRCAADRGPSFANDDGDAAPRLWRS